MHRVHAFTVSPHRGVVRDCHDRREAANVAWRARHVESDRSCVHVGLSGLAQLSTRGCQAKVSWLWMVTSIAALHALK